MSEEGQQRAEQPASEPPASEPPPASPASPPRQAAANPPPPHLPPPPPPEAWQRPVRIEPVAGTPYGLAILGAPEATSGPAIGALVSGVAALVVSLIVTCLGLAGAAAGWGVWVAGAFAVLAGSLGAAGVGLGLVGMRQVRRQSPPAPSQWGGYPASQHPHAPYQPGQAGGGYVAPAAGPSADVHEHPWGRRQAGHPWAPQPEGQHPWAGRYPAHHPPAPAGPTPPAGSGAVRPVRGRAMAVAGLVCGASALVVVVCSLLGAAVIQLA